MEMGRPGDVDHVQCIIVVRGGEEDGEDAWTRVQFDIASALKAHAHSQAHAIPADAGDPEQECGRPPQGVGSDTRLWRRAGPTRPAKKLVGAPIVSQKAKEIPTEII